jgi:hypothetical protein
MCDISQSPAQPGYLPKLKFSPGPPAYFPWHRRKLVKKKKTLLFLLSSLILPWEWSASWCLSYLLLLQPCLLSATKLWRLCHLPAWIVTNWTMSGGWTKLLWQRSIAEGNGWLFLPPGSIGGHANGCCNLSLWSLSAVHNLFFGTSHMCSLCNCSAPADHNSFTPTHSILPRKKPLYVVFAE